MAELGRLQHSYGPQADTVEQIRTEEGPPELNARGDCEPSRTATSLQRSRRLEYGRLQAHRY
jgi:hypothetical protein